MRPIDIVLIAVIVLLLAGAVVLLIRNRRRGSGCCGNCSECARKSCPSGTLHPADPHRDNSADTQ